MDNNYEVFKWLSETATRLMTTLPKGDKTSDKGRVTTRIKGSWIEVEFTYQQSDTVHDFLEAWALGHKGQDKFNTRHVHSTGNNKSFKVKFISRTE